MKGKKTARKKTAAKKRTNASANTPQANRANREIIALVKIGLGIFLFLSVYIENGAGTAGRFTKSAVCGLIGFGAYTAPFLLAGFGVYDFFRQTVKKRGVFFILVFMVISLVHVIGAGKAPVYDNPLRYLTGLYQNGSLGNGGVVGGIFGDMLYALIGKPAAVIMLVIGTLITGVVYSGHSASEFFITVASLFSNFFMNKEGEDVERSDERISGTDPVLPESGMPAPGRHAPGIEASPPAKSKKHRKNKMLKIGNGETINSNNKILLIPEELVANKKVNPILTRRPRPGPGKNDKNSFIDIGAPQSEKADETGYPFRDDADVSADEYGLINDEYEGANDQTLLDGSAIDAENEDLAENDEPLESGWDSGFPPHGEYGAPEGSGPYGHNPEYANRKIEYAAQFKMNRNGNRGYELPPLDILRKNNNISAVGSQAEVNRNSKKLEETLASFRVDARVSGVSIGPTVTRYEMTPGQGVKVNAIANLANDLALSLAAQSIRIEAPIPGKSAVGIEIPNKETQPVFLRELLEDGGFQKYPSKLAFAVGKDIGGNVVVADIAKMPHLLIAGATGSGKSVCINTLIASILFKASPDEVKFLMVDPKIVELKVYNGIPHLMIPVVTDPKKAAGALNWAVMEMDRRYGLFAEANVRDLNGYNNHKTDDAEIEPLPQIVIIIDELADLMMVSKGEVEEAICRLAQKARAAGLYLIVATQRPSVDVITGLIKANIPSRMAFAVSSGIDSRTVLDMIGAEKLLGKGDMLFLPVGLNKPARIQCGFISEMEVESLVDFLKTQNIMEYDEALIENVTDPGFAAGLDGDPDEFFEEAVDFLIQKGKASASMLQRQFRIGYNRASRLIEELETRGIVGPEDGSKPRKVLINRSGDY